MFIVLLYSLDAPLCMIFNQYKCESLHVKLSYNALHYCNACLTHLVTIFLKFYILDMYYVMQQNY